jgi:hypothetical protein
MACHVIFSFSSEGKQYTPLDWTELIQETPATELLYICFSISGKACTLGLAFYFFDTLASTGRKEIDAIQKIQIENNV